MRQLRPYAALLAIAAVIVACSSSPGASSGGQGGGASQPGTSTGGGGAANGSVTYEISGGYTRSGELPWVPERSVFTNGSWYMSFADASGTGKIILVISTPGIIFGNTEIAIPDGIEPACTFTFTRQDANGAAGSFDCHGLQGVKSNTTTVSVDFKGSFDGHK